MRKTSVLFVAAAIAAAWPPAATAGEPGAEQAGAETSGEEPAVEISAEARAILGRLDAAGSSRLAVAVELAGDYPWPKLVEALGEVSGDFRRPERAEILMDALARMGREKLREMLVFAAQDGADSYLRLVSLQVAIRAGAETPFAEVLSLAAALPEAQRFSPSTRLNVRDAVRASLESAPAEVETLRARWGKIDSVLRTICLEALEKTGARLGARAVSRLLATGAEGDDEILLRLATMPLFGAEPFAPGTEIAVLRCLESTNAAERRAAALVAGRIGGMTIAARLLEALADPDPSVVAAAGRGLVAATGVALVPDADLWRVRLEEESKWLAESAAADRDALRDADASVVVAVLGRLALHRVHRDEIAPWIEDCLDHHETVVRRTAGRALARLGRPASIPALLAATGDPAADCALGASNALAAVTGLPAPKKPSDWRALLAAR